MMKSALVFGALNICAVANAFVPTSTKVSPLWHGASTLTNERAASFSRVPRCVTCQRDIRTARTSLFSAPTTSSEQVPAVPAAVPEPAPASLEKKSPGPLRVGLYFGLWYLLNIGYNIYNKRVLNIFPLPWLVATVQMGVGILYFVPLWLTKLRQPPKLYKGALTPLRYVLTGVVAWRRG